MVSRAHGLRPAVFLDRDGVIVVPEFRDGRSFAPRRLEDFRLYPDAAASLQKLKQAGFLLAVVTNQPDVGDGLIAHWKWTRCTRSWRVNCPSMPSRRASTGMARPATVASQSRV